MNQLHMTLTLNKSFCLSILQSNVPDTEFHQSFHFACLEIEASVNKDL